MRALTLKQPYAWAIISAGKQVENRSWNTRHRGRFYVHAGVSWSPQEAEWIEREIGISVPAREDLVFGGIIGTVALYDVITDSHDPWAIPGNYHWLLREPRELARPIPASGKQGWWTYVRSR